MESVANFSSKLTLFLGGSAIYPSRYIYFVEKQNFILPDEIYYVAYDVISKIK